MKTTKENSVIKNCPNCNEKMTINLSGIKDDDIICNCGQLIFLSDFGLCKKTYQIFRVQSGSHPN